MYDFFNGNLFQTLIMILVGSFAFGIYYFQKKDELKNAAAMVKLEIDNIEKALNNLKLTLLPEEIYKTAPLYQTLEWYKIRNLFIGKIDIENFNAINTFYEMVVISEDARSKMKEAIHLNRIDKINATQFHISSILCSIAQKDPDKNIQEILQKNKEEALLKLAQFQKLYNDGDTSPDFLMKSATDHYNRALSSVFCISNTPAYEKLKKLL